MKSLNQGKVPPKNNHILNPSSVHTSFPSFISSSISTPNHNLSMGRYTMRGYIFQSTHQFTHFTSLSHLYIIIFLLPLNVYHSLTIPERHLTHNLVAEVAQQSSHHTFSNVLGHVSLYQSQPTDVFSLHSRRPLRGSWRRPTVVLRFAQPAPLHLRPRSESSNSKTIAPLRMSHKKPGTCSTRPPPTAAAQSPVNSPRVIMPSNWSL